MRPWLFPVVGASSGGVVRVDGTAYPMGQHGFARDLPFTIVSQSDDSVTLRLIESEATCARYPYPFQLDITTRVGPAHLDFEIWIENTGGTNLPYALGFHPGLPLALRRRGAQGGWRLRGGVRAP